MNTQAPKETGKYDAQRKYQQKMRENGFTRLTLWVHQDDVEKLTKYAFGMRKQRSSLTQ